MMSLYQPWRRLSTLIGLLLGTVVVGVASCASSEVIEDETGDRPKVLMMHYMPWFQTPEIRGRWGEHWTGWDKQHDPAKLNADGLADIDSNYHPLIGVYDSADPDAIECQLLQMKLAGIDGVIVDWYGIVDAADYGGIHEATQEMFEQAERFGMDFAVCYEDSTVKWMIDNEVLKPTEADEHLVETLEWMEREWFGAEHYMRVDGMPLMLNFGPLYYTEAEQWESAFKASGVRPSFFGLHHLWQGVGGDGGFTWVHPKAWEGEPSGEQIAESLVAEYTERTSEPSELIVSAYPGFDDIYAKSYPSLAYRGGETLRESLGVGMAGDWPIIQLVTWNDYGEGTMIEPTREHGYTFLEVVQGARRAEMGESFAFTPEDLRLPVRLYELRKNSAESRGTLDRISGFLRDGECERARAALVEAEG